MSSEGFAAKKAFSGSTPSTERSASVKHRSEQQYSFCYFHPSTAFVYACTAWSYCSKLSAEKPAL